MWLILYNDINYILININQLETRTKNIHRRKFALAYSSFLSLYLYN